MRVEVEADGDGQPRGHRADAAQQLALAVVDVLGHHGPVQREERRVAPAADGAHDGVAHVLVGALLDVARGMGAGGDGDDDLRAHLLGDVQEPAELGVGVLELLDGGVAGERAEDASGVGTGENVLVSCIIVATTILRRAMAVLQHGLGDAGSCAPISASVFTVSGRTTTRVAPASRNFRTRSRSAGWP